MPLDPEGIVHFDHAGERYLLFFGMRAMKEIEQHFDKPFMRALQGVMPQLATEDLGDKAKIAEASADIRLGDIGKLFEFGLVKHHPELGEEAAEALIDAIGVGRASELLGQAISAALGSGEGDEASPPHPRKASRRGKTGSPS